MATPRVAGIWNQQEGDMNVGSLTWTEIWNQNPTSPFGLGGCPSFKKGHPQTVCGLAVGYWAEINIDNPHTSLLLGNLYSASSEDASAFKDNAKVTVKIGSKFLADGNQFKSWVPIGMVWKMVSNPFEPNITHCWWTSHVLVPSIRSSP